MDDEQKRKNRERLEAAILPTSGSGRAPRYIGLPAAKQPDWDYWRYMPKVAPWQACALAQNIDPGSVIQTNDGMGVAADRKLTHL